MSRFTESKVEEVAFEILSELGYSTFHGLDIAPDGTPPKTDVRRDSHHHT